MVLGGFWEAKIINFRTFSTIFFDAKFGVQVGKAKNRKKTQKCKVSGRFGGPCGLGGKDLGWGEACLSLKFQALP